MLNVQCAIRPSALSTDRRACGLGGDVESAASPAVSEGKGKPEGKAKKGAKDKKADQGRGKNTPPPIAASGSSATDNDSRAVGGRKTFFLVVLVCL